MELGEKLKNARLEAGLSQRQLCSDTITRNMLSQIENGSAKPSYATLRILSSRLGKPVSYFLENAPSENLELLHRASQAEPKEALAILEGYLKPDPMLDSWYSLLSARCRMALARQALAENRAPYARSLLEQIDGSALGEELKKELILLQYASGMASAGELSSQLPDNTEEMLLRAAGALERGNPELCLNFLAGADRQTESRYLLQGDALVQLQNYEEAIPFFLAASSCKEIYARLELCYRELGNFEKAYEYACKQR